MEPIDVAVGLGLAGLGERGSPAPHVGLAAVVATDDEIPAGIRALLGR